MEQAAGIIMDAWQRCKYSRCAMRGKGRYYGGTSTRTLVPVCLLACLPGCLAVWRVMISTHSTVLPVWPVLKLPTKARGREGEKERATR